MPSIANNAHEGLIQKETKTISNKKTSTFRTVSEDFRVPYTLHLAASDARALQEEGDATNDKGSMSSKIQQMQETKNQGNNNNNGDDEDENEEDRLNRYTSSGLWY